MSRLEELSDAVMRIEEDGQSNQHNHHHDE
jgi:hypothetical protein